MATESMSAPQQEQSHLGCADGHRVVLVELQTAPHLALQLTLGGQVHDKQLRLPTQRR